MMPKDGNSKSEALEPEYTAQVEIDTPLDYSPRRADPGFRPSPMSDETKLKLKYSMRIAIICFIVIGAIVVIEVIFAALSVTMESAIIDTVLDLMRMIMLLTIGFMFGNQSKN